MPTVYNRLHRYGFTNLTKEQKWELGGLVRAAYTTSGINILIYRKKSIENGEEYIVRDYHPRFNDAMDKVIFEYCAVNHIESESLITEKEQFGNRKKTCSKCDKPIEPNRIGKTGYCKKCQTKYNKTYRRLDKEKVSARQKANRELPEKQPCENCGNPDTERHHEDYSKPLEVSWLCEPCHLERHNKFSAADAARKRKRNPVKTPAYSSKSNKNQSNG